MPTRQQGFSLLEILVAFSILAVSLGVLMQIFSSSLRNADVSRRQAQAVALAQSLLAAAGIEAPLAQGEQSGTVDEQFRWTLTTTPMTLGGSEEAATPKPIGGLELWELTAQVSWGGQGSERDRSLELTTLRLQAPPKP